jgi:hypothetical protein
MVKNRCGSNPSRSAGGEIFYADTIGSQQERFCDTRLSLEKFAAWVRRLTETVKDRSKAREIRLPDSCSISLLLLYPFSFADHIAIVEQQIFFGSFSGILCQTWS